MPKGIYQRFKKEDILSNPSTKAYGSLNELSRHIIGLLTIRDVAFRPDLPANTAYKEVGKSLENQIRNSVLELEKEFNRIYGISKPEETKNVLAFNSVNSQT